MKKYLSFSELNLWYRDRKRYVDYYINGIEDTTFNRPLVLGKLIHKIFEEPRYPWLKELKEMGEWKMVPIIHKLLKKVKREGLAEQTIFAEFEDFKIMAIMDRYDKKNRFYREYKTYTPEAGEEWSRWTQWKVDHHKQLSFTALVLKLNSYTYFKEIVLDAIDLAKGNIKSYKTTRGPADLVEITEWIRKGVNEIKVAGLWDKRLSREERGRLYNLKLPL